MEAVDVHKDAAQLLPAFRCQAATEALKQKGYYISAGMAWTSAPAGDLGPLLEDAERRMYEAKRLFYQDPRFNRRAR